MRLLTVKSSEVVSHPNFEPVGYSMNDKEEPCHYYVPRKRVKDFVGRETQLDQISSHFWPNTIVQPQVLILHAFGGQGKSQIALQYCQSSRERYRGVFWVNASSKALVVQSYARIAAALSGSSPANFSEEERLIRIMKEHLYRLGGHSLMVFDNYDDPQSFPTIQQFLPERKWARLVSPPFAEFAPHRVL